VRNVLYAIGNSGDPALADEAERLLDDRSPVVRGAAVWAMGRLLDARRRSGACADRHDETDDLVLAEWTAASPPARPEGRG
jgi:epoxyqueuosine reductase